MKMLLMTVVGATFMVGSAPAQNQAGGTSSTAAERPVVGPNTTGAGPVPNGVRPSGAPGAPNRPRAFGETNDGRTVNPDRVPPLSPGGQGLNAESR
jgi:hypothetical protein